MVNVADFTCSKLAYRVHTCTYIHSCTHHVPYRYKGVAYYSYYTLHYTTLHYTTLLNILHIVQN
jgi:hypothetical protein